MTTTENRLVVLALSVRTNGQDDPEVVPFTDLNLDLDDLDILVDAEATRMWRDSIRLD